MTAPDLDALLAKAEKALGPSTPSPHDGAWVDPDYLFSIAAKPQTIIALIQRVKLAEAREAELRAAANEVVAGVDNWNAHIQSIIGRQVNYDWGGLERLRAALASDGSLAAAVLRAAEGLVEMMERVTDDSYGTDQEQTLIAAIDAWRAGRKGSDA